MLPVKSSSAFASVKGNVGRGQDSSPVTDPRRIAHRIARTVDDVDFTRLAVGKFRIHLIDVGTGLSVLVQGRDFNFLFDGGSSDDKRGISNSANNSRLLAYLWEALGDSGPIGCQPGARKLDKENNPQRRLQTVVLSQPHEQHGVFLSEVLRCFAVSDVYDAGVVSDAAFYGDFIQAISEEPGVTYHTAAAPPTDGIQTVGGADHHIAGGWEQFAESKGEADRVELGLGASFRILHANGGSHRPINENAIVLRLDMEELSLLLIGGAGSGARQAPTEELGDIEAHLVALHPEAIDVDILQVGHQASTRVDFLNAVSPKWALLSPGPRSTSSVVSPDSRVVEALVTAVGDKARVLRTDTNDGVGCPAKDRIGSDEARPGGCDGHVLEFTTQHTYLSYLPF